MNNSFHARACAGKTMALDTIWIAIASILTVFDITKAVDENGDVVTPEVKLNPGSIRRAVFHFANRKRSDFLCRDSHPAPFKCSIKPRSRTTLSLIQHGRN